MWRAIVSALAAATLVCGCSRRTSTVVVHTTDTVRIAASTTERLVRDTVSVTLPAQSAERTVADTVSHLSIAYARSMARINPDGTLTHTLQSLDTPVQVPVERRHTSTTLTEHRDRTRELPVPVSAPLTLWQRLRLAAFWPLTILLLLMGALCRFRR